MTSPNIGAYNNAATTVGTSPTLIATVMTDGDGVLVQNTGSVTVYLGGELSRRPARTWGSRSPAPTLTSLFHPQADHRISCTRLRIRQLRRSWSYFHLEREARPHGVWKLERLFDKI